MAFRHGKSTKVLVDEFDLSSYFNEANPASTVEAAETTTFGKNSKTYITGLMDGSISLSGFFDGDANAVDHVLEARLGSDTAVTVTVAPEGLTIGRRVFSASTRETNYEVSNPVGDVVSVSAEVQVTGGMRSGVSLHALTSENSAGNDSSVDNAASSSDGGVGYLHVTANDRDGAVVVKVQHSADNITFADLITFTSITAATKTSERLTVDGTVNRYVRGIRSSVGGATGSLTYALVFVRGKTD